MKILDYVKIILFFLLILLLIWYDHIDNNTIWFILGMLFISLFYILIIIFIFTYSTINPKN